MFIDPAHGALAVTLTRRAVEHATTLEHAADRAAMVGGTAWALYRADPEPLMSENRAIASQIRDVD